MYQQTTSLHQELARKHNDLSEVAIDGLVKFNQGISEGTAIYPQQGIGTGMIVTKRDAVLDRAADIIRNIPGHQGYSEFGSIYIANQQIYQNFTEKLRAAGDSRDMSSLNNSSEDVVVGYANQ